MRVDKFAEVSEDVLPRAAGIRVPRERVGRSRGDLSPRSCPLLKSPGDVPAVILDETGQELVLPRPQAERRVLPQSRRELRLRFAHHLADGLSFRGAGGMSEAATLK